LRAWVTGASLGPFECLHGRANVARLEGASPDVQQKLATFAIRPKERECPGEQVACSVQIVASEGAHTGRAETGSSTAPQRARQLVRHAQLRTVVACLLEVVADDLLVLE